MEPTFQTTFIPKKPLVENRDTNSSGGVSLLVLSSTILLVISCALAAGMYLYRVRVDSTVTDMQRQLEQSSISFDADLAFNIEDTNHRLTVAQDLLNNHVSFSPLLITLGENTLKTIRYTKMNAEQTVGPKAVTTVKISGVAKNYDAIALQSDMYAKNRFIRDPIFSNLIPTIDGNISFDLAFTVDPSYMKYTNHIAK